MCPDLQRNEKMEIIALQEMEWPKNTDKFSLLIFGGAGGWGCSCCGLGRGGLMAQNAEVVHNGGGREVLHSFGGFYIPASTLPWDAAQTLFSAGLRAQGTGRSFDPD